MLAGFRRCTCAVAPKTPYSRTISPFAMHVPAPRSLYQSTSVLAGTNGPIGMPESKTCSSGCRCQAMLARLRRRYRTGGVPVIASGALDRADVRAPLRVQTRVVAHQGEAGVLNGNM